MEALRYSTHKSIMTIATRFLSVFAITAVLAGCAGTDFKRPDPQSLVVGKSTAADVTRVMGAPRQVGEVLKNEQKIKTARYVYATTGGESLYSGVVPARAMVFSTFNDVLIGQEFVSSFKIDATEFDDSKVKSIIKGKTTHQEVEALLGKPSGEVIYPIIKKVGEKAYVYGYSHAKGNAFNMKFYAKTLVVSLDPAGVVSDVEYTSAGDK
jgi:outer membrane protein assembly factor BamE (lipoprotein component of BamABCDE complex)